MERLNSKLERESQKAPVKFILGYHDAENTPRNLFLFEQALETQLQRTPYGHVLAIIEDAGAPLTCASQIENSIKGGTLPSIAYIRAIFYEQNLRTPENGEELTAQKKLLRSKDQNVQILVKELKILDELFISYPGRLRLVWEGNPEENIRLESWRRGHLQKMNILIALRLVSEGKFKEALPYFKNVTTDLAEEAAEREKKIEEKILTSVKENQIVGAVCYFGTAHTHLAHFLSSSGFAVKIVFPQKEHEKTYVYNPLEAIVRTLRFFPEKEITDLEWLKALLGYTFRGDLGMPDQEANRRILKTLSKNFPDLASIEEFERQVRKKGLIKATRNIS